MITVFIILGSIIAFACLVFVVNVIYAQCKNRNKVLKRSAADEWLVGEFERCNVMVYGKKRQGKDLIFMHVIAMRGQKHYANIPYNFQTEVITLDEINLGDNTFEDCINGTITPIDPRFDEGCDIYISDGGIHLCSDYNQKLLELYPSMPMFFALSGQVYGLNVHINSQALVRVWSKLREQADSYIRCIRTTRKGDCLYVDIEAYDKYSKAEQEKDPYKRCKICIPIHEIKYDTRYFRKVFLNQDKFSRKRSIQHAGELKHVQR